MRTQAKVLWQEREPSKHEGQKPGQGCCGIVFGGARDEPTEGDKLTPRPWQSVLKVLVFVLIEWGASIGFRLAGDTSGFSSLKFSLVPPQS